MDGVAKRELTEVEMILGKGMLYDSSGLTELVNMYYLKEHGWEKTYNEIF